MPSQIDVIFNADTGRYVANVNAATGATNKSAEAVAAAKNKILESFEAQIKKAESLGASQQKLQSIAERSASQMSAVTEQNANRIIANLDRIAQKQRQVQSELENFKVPTAGEGNDITNRQRASALIRGGGIRSAENFASQFEAFNKLSTLAFPVIGAATFVAEIVRGVEALKEMYDTAERLPQVLGDGWRDINRPLETHVDTIRKANAELGIAIAKLEHKPENALALALADDRLRADQLADSAQHAYGEVKKLLDANKNGFFAQTFLDKGATQDVTDEIEKRQRAVADLQDKYREQVRGGADKSVIEATAAQVRQTIADNAAYARREISTRSGSARTEDVVNDDGSVSRGIQVTYAQEFGNQDANLANLRGFRNFNDNQLDDIDQGNQNTALQQQQKRDQEAKDKQTAATEAERKAQEAARKAFEATKARWKQEDDAREQTGDNTPFASMKAWQDRIAQSKPNSAQQQYANTEYTSVYKAWAEKDEAAIREGALRAQKAQREAWELSHDEWTAASHRTAQDEADFWSIRMLEAANGSENYRHAQEKELQAERELQTQREAADKARNKAALERGQQQTQYDEAVLGIRKMTGQISAADAATQLANIHAEQYRQKLAALGDELARQQGIDPNSAGSIEAQAAIDKAAAERRVQVQQDAAAMAATTWEGALRNANSVMVQDAEDSAKQVVQLYQQAFNGLNENLTDLMTGQKSHFGEMFRGISKTLAGDALKHLEAPAMKGLNGLLGNPGKPDGSEQNPLHVKIAGGMGGGSGSTGALGRALFPGGSPSLPSATESGGDDGDDSDSDSEIPASTGAKAAGGFVRFLGSVANMFIGGHRALGGRVQPGVSYDVGEMGREEFVPDQPGTIVPTNQLGRNGASYTIVNQAGVTPEQMHTHVQAALKQFHPQVVRASVAAVQDHHARHPVATR